MNTNISTQSAEQTSLFQATYKLYVSWYIRCQSIPKKDRFTIGQKTENMLLEILTLVVAAYHAKDHATKIKALSRVNILLECVKIILRLAKDVKAIKQCWYIEYEKNLQNINQMLERWIFSQNKTNSR